MRSRRIDLGTLILMGMYIVMMVKAFLWIAGIGG